MAKIELNNIAHSYNPHDANPLFALKEMSLSWADGGTVCFIRPIGLREDNHVKYYEWLSDPISWSR
jgi:hypothetical protein